MLYASNATEAEITIEIIINIILTLSYIKIKGCGRKSLHLRTLKLIYMRFWGTFC